MDSKFGPTIYLETGPVPNSEAGTLLALNIPKKYFDSQKSYVCEQKKIIWIGKVEDNMPNGYGIFIYLIPKRIVVLVDAREGYKEGSGKIHFEDGSYFQALFRKDEFDGTTDYFTKDAKKILSAKFLVERNVEIQYTKSGQLYIGEHYYLMKHGRGKLFKDKTQTMQAIEQDGIFRYDVFVKGYVKQDFYIGEVCDDEFEGSGCLFYDKECTRKRAEGNFRQGQLNGAGKEYFEEPPNVIKYEGMFSDSVYDGEGAMTVLEPKKRTFRGKFRHGAMTGTIDVLDELERLFQRARYKDGELSDVVEEYYYNIKLPTMDEITEDELKHGEIDTQTFEKVIYNNEVSSLRYYRKQKDETPWLIMQVDPKIFLIKYEGILSHSGSLVFTGEMKHLLFEGKGTLRYMMKNEPRKYIGEFFNGLFDGPGELYSHLNQILYSGEWRQNKFDGKGVLIIHSIYLVGNSELNPKELARGKFESDRYNVEVDGLFHDGRFLGGVWRYTGTSDAVQGKVLSLKVSKKSDTLLGKMYENKIPVFEGLFEEYTFHGKGILHYNDGVTVKYDGDFFGGNFHGEGKLNDRKGHLIYQGSFVHGAYQGFGKLCYGLPENLIYEGEFVDGKINGKGKMLERDGSIRSDGTYKDGNLVEGFVKIYYPEGPLQYEGGILKGKYNGEGTCYTALGEITMKGTFLNGYLMEGQRRDFYPSGSIEKEGMVKFGKYEGKVKEYYFDGKVQYEGIYQNGQKNGEGIAYHRNGKQKQVGTFKDDVFFEGDAVYYHSDNITIKFEGRVRNMYYNGFGKKYHENGCLEYEGGFKNGLFDGEGTYYYSDEKDKIKFRGTFAEGAPKGHGELYDLKGNLIYNGEMLNWRKEGQGVLYSPKGEFLLEGIFSEDNIYRGSGKLYWPGFGTLKYEGEFDNSWQEGKGVSYFTNGNIEFDGHFKGGYPEGKGTLYDENENGKVLYVGEMQRGRYHGQGVQYCKDETYEGEFKQGKRNGMGVLKYNDPALGVKFEGLFYVDDMDEGKATLYEDGKLVYQGTMRRHLYDGNGKKYYPSGQLDYEGGWKEGLYEGHGTKYYESGKKQYEGEWLKGKYNGKGKQWREDGTIAYDGEVIKGQYNHFGTIYDEKGFKIYSGNLINGEYTGHGEIYFPQTNKLKFKGELSKGIFNGSGEKYTKKGFTLKYVGNFHDGKFQEGKIFQTDGVTLKYEGQMKNKQYHGYGILYTQKGLISFRGALENGKYHGKGVLYHPDSDKVQYEGPFVNGKPDGDGEFRYANGNLQFKGTVRAGVPNGRGIYYTEDGKPKQEGLFVNGVFTPLKEQSIN